MSQAFSKIWIIVIVVVLIAGGIFAYKYWWVPKEETKIAIEEMVEEEKGVQDIQEKIEFCKEAISIYAKWQCYIDLAKEKKDETYCEKIEDNLYRSDCYKDLAVIKEEEALCDKIPFHLLKISRPSCYANVALKKNDETICDKLSNSEENGSCYERFAF